MKNRILGILGILLPTMILSGACSRTQNGYAYEEIRYALSVSSTKVMSAADFEEKDNKMAVYDVFVNSQDKYINYINGASVVSPGNGGIWDFENGDKYYWLQGTHNFWGYSTYYKKTNTSFDDLFDSKSTFDLGNQKLNIAQTVVNWDSPQFDFVYSKPEIRVIDSSTSNTAPVELKCQHFFSAIGINAVNKLPHSTVTITKIYLKNLKNTNTATVKFNCNENQVSYGTPSVTGSYAEVVLSKTLQPSGVCNDIFNPESDKNGYYLVWPQDDLTPHPSEDAEGEIIYDPNDALICVEYTINDSETLTREVPYPTIKNSSGEKETIKLVAGKKHLITLNFVNKMLELDLQVLPWDYEETILDYSDDTAQADPIYVDPSTSKKTYLLYDYDRLSDDGSGGLILDPSKATSIVDDNAKTVTISMGRPVKARFRLNSPKGAEWMVDLVGQDRRDFTVEKLTDNTIDGTNCNFQIKPKNTSPTREYRVNVRITLRLADGRTVSVDPVLQGGENLTEEYTIIQPKAL